MVYCMCLVALKDNLFDNLFFIMNESLRIIGKILCKFIVILEKSLDANFYIHFIFCRTKYLSGSNIYFFHFSVSTEALEESCTID